MRRSHNIGIVGLGGISASHLRAFKAIGKRVSVVGAADLDPERLSNARNRHHISRVRLDYRELINDSDIDIIDVCTPPREHEAIIVDALKAGKFVICEKPLAHTLESADRILDVSNAYPGRLSTIYQLQYHPEIRRMIWLRDCNSLGELQFGKFSRYIQRSNVKKVDWWGKWEVAGGGITITQFIHQLDLMIQIFGPAVEAIAMIESFDGEFPSEDTCVAIIRFENGAIGSCMTSMAVHHTESAYEVVGSRASIHSPWRFECANRAFRTQSLRAILKALDLPSGLLRCPGAGTLIQTLVGMLGRKLVPFPSWKLHASHFRACIEAIEANQPLPLGPKLARASLELCTALYASALRRKPIALPLSSTNPFYRGIDSDDYMSVIQYKELRQNVRGSFGK